MSFGRQKRLLLGWLALLAPVPLPFNGVVSWPFYLVYSVGVGLFLIRASRDRERWLPVWAMKRRRRLIRPGNVTTTSRCQVMNNRQTRRLKRGNRLLSVAKILKTRIAQHSGWLFA